MAFLSAPFRPFFFLTALTAVCIPMYFVCILVNDYPYPGELLTSFAWHGHEMFFGFTSALLTGFLLTASAHWTGKKVVTPTGIFFFLVVWFISRILMFVQPNAMLLYILVPLPILLFLLKIFHVLWGNRNLIPVTGTVLCLYIANVLHLYSSVNSETDLVEVSYTLGSGAVFFILFLFSGRLMTFFTNSKLKKQVIGLDSKSDILLAILCSLTFVFKMANYSTPELILAPICALLLLRRGYVLFHREVLKIPMLLILHVAHSWFLIYFVMRIFALSLPDLEVGQSGYHALLAGALSTFALGIMSRASLGHTGREIKADKWINISFVSLTFGALLRVLHPILMGETITMWLHISMGFWTLAYLIFLVKFTPIYLKPRL